MTARRSTLDVDGLQVAVARKRIKHLYVKVSRADGSVRVSAPLRADDRLVRDAVRAKLGWIREKQRTSSARPPRRAQRLDDGEVHQVWGEARRLRVVEVGGRARVDVSHPDELALCVRSGSTREARRDLLDGFYRAELKARIPELIACWEPVVGRSVAAWGVKKMKTRWGSCNPRARRIWLGLELAKKPPECLEYVVVHEMAHLIEANHSKRFYVLMDRFMPDWRERKRVLESA